MVKPTHLGVDIFIVFRSEGSSKLATENFGQLI